MNLPDSDPLRPVLAPAGNTTAKPLDSRKQLLKAKKSPTLSPVARDSSKLMPSILRKQQRLGSDKVFKCSVSMNASCSSDASSDSTSSRASTGRILRRSVPNLRRLSAPKLDGGNVEVERSLAKKRCAWVTSNAGMLLIVTTFLFVC